MAVAAYAPRLGGVGLAGLAARFILQDILPELHLATQAAASPAPGCGCCLDEERFEWLKSPWVFLGLLLFLSGPGWDVVDLIRYAWLRLTGRARHRLVPLYGR